MLSSEATFDVSKEYLAAHKAPAGPFKVNLKADALQLVGKMDRADGAYIQRIGNAQPFVHIRGDLVELEEVDQRVIDMIQNKK